MNPSRTALILVAFLYGMLGTAFGMGSVTIEGNKIRKSEYHCVIRSMVEDDRGRFWVGTFGAGLFRFDDKGWKQYLASDSGLPDNRLSKLLIASNTLFMVTAGGGGATLGLKDERWQMIGNASAPASRHFHALWREPDGNMILGSVGEGLFIGSGTSWVHLTDRDGLPHNWVNDAVAASGGHWIGSYEGLGFLRDRKIAWVEMPKFGWFNSNVNVLAWFRGELMLGTAGGGLTGRSVDPTQKSRLHPDFRAVRFRPIPDCGGIVHALLPDGNRLWIGCEDGLYRVTKDGPAEKVIGPWPAKDAVKSLAFWKGRLIVGTAEGRLIRRNANQSWHEIFDYAKYLGSGGKKQ